ncbi:MAG: CPBP family intramembrane metalloprotease [Bacilli bacterium]|nr:CPBP family intramembrane metalloprotease [Bacilli bacterium]
MKDSLKIIRFFFSFCCFMFISIPIVLFLREILGMTLNGSDYNDLILVDTIHSVILVIIVFILYFDKIKDATKKIKTMGGENFIKKVIISGLMLFVVKIGAGIVISILTVLLGLDSTSVENQELVEKMLVSAPLVMMISVSILAPITEELIFRAGISDVVKNKRVFIAVSGLIFGLMHVTGSVVLFMEILLIGIVLNRILSDEKIKKSTKIMLSVIASVLILMLFTSVYMSEFGNLIVKIKSLDLVEVIGSIVYITMGIYLAKLYTEDENILYTIFVHGFNNFVSVLLIM